MRQFFGVIVLAACMLFGAQVTSASAAAVTINIDVSDQVMRVDSPDGNFTWKVSTARSGYHTPRGSWKPYLLKKMHYSRKYDNSPMPHSIFFLGGYAIHGTGYVKKLGQPASHGCVRLLKANAATLFSLVQKYGMSNTRVVITN